MYLNQRNVTSILIVGGGSAGWITATLLDRYLNNGSTEKVQISLLESPEIPTIGVGEATVPSIRKTLSLIGVSERDFFNGTDATLKSAIRFKDWHIGKSFDHPFDRRNRATTDEAVSTWLTLKNSGEEFSKQFSLLSNLCDANLAPKGIGWPDYNSAFPYAYHLDATKFANLLAGLGTSRGVTHYLDTLVEVNVTESGVIDTVEGKSGRQYGADLFIDCTGFRSKVISTIEPKVISFESSLLCDAAVTLQIPYSVYKPKALIPYTISSAQNAGWCWDINLQNRRGVGYVYSSAFLDSAEAEKELRQKEGQHSDALMSKHIRFRPFKRERSWVKNCVAIGLSDCFVEPLESSGLFMIEFAANLLAESICGKNTFSDATSSHFNRVMKSLSEEVVEFVSLHYLTSSRSDRGGFWSEATNLNRASDRLQYLLEEWKTRKMLDTDLLKLNRLFSFESYEYLLYGMEHTLLTDRKVSRDFRHSIQQDLTKCLNNLPTHEKWISSIVTS